MRRRIDLSVGEFYHIYNRGTDKRDIFLDQHDHGRFIALLYASNGSTPVDISKHFREGGTFPKIFDIERGDALVDIVAYCLMPNHFHILIREKTENGIQKFMSKVSTGYSVYFNKKNERTGALFESRFKAKHVDTDEYLKYLFAYIHLNPIKIIDAKWKDLGISDLGAAQRCLNDYKYSSYPDWKGRCRVQTKILNREASPEYFSVPQDFSDFVNEWLSYKDNMLK